MNNEAYYAYHFIEPRRSIVIDRLYTLHYFENHRDYYFSGERHDFWEMLYVDRGEVIADTDQMEAPLHLAQGDVLLYRPNEFHRTYANNITPCNLLVVSFHSHSRAMDYFLTNTLFHTHGEARQQLGLLLLEAKRGFSHALGDPALSVQRRPDADFGSEQLVIMMLEWLLVRLYRGECCSAHSAESDAENRLSSHYVDLALLFLKQNLHRPITLDDVCTHVNMSRSQLQKAFHRRIGTSVMHYLIQLRMEEAKFLIRTGELNFTEIACEFGYSSVHHFSRQFHQIAGMSPTEYARSVHAMVDALGS